MVTVGRRRGTRPAVAIFVASLLLAVPSGMGVGVAEAHPGAEDAGDPARVGQWAEPFWEGGAIPDPWTIEHAKEHPTAASMVVLPDGRILYWNGLEGFENQAIGVDYPEVVENARARILNLGAPESGDESWTIPAPERGTDHATPGDQSLFCADQKLLYDGTVLIAGGENRPDDILGLRETRIFSPDTDSFSFTDEMDYPRWYPSLITLADGRVLALSGAESILLPSRADTSYKNVREAEIYDPVAASWKQVAPSPLSFPLYPRLHLVPGGRVFYGGTGSGWSPSAESPDMAGWGLQRLFDPAAGDGMGAWETRGLAKYGARNFAMSVLLRFERGSYDEGRVLMAGGTLGPPTAVEATTISDVTTITQDGEITNDPALHGPFDGLLGDDSQLNNPRWHSTPVLLPTGEVLVFSGAERDELVVFNPTLENALRTPEIYDPDSNTWSELASSARSRAYHNTAALLPDGRVLVGGHAPAYVAEPYRDSTFEIFTPPYLFRGERPVVQGVGVRQRGTELLVRLATGTAAADIADVALVRIPSVTHGLDSDQRAVALEFAPTDEGEALVAQLPNGGDGSILPPGPYYLFVLDHEGVPSVAPTVFVKPAGGGTVLFERGF